MTSTEDLYHSSMVTNCVLNASLSYTAIALNIITIYAMRKTSSLPRPLRTLLLSLAVSDLGVGIFLQPYYVVLLVIELKGADPVDKSMDNAMYAMAETFSIVSFLSVFVLSVDRFLAVHLHLRYQELVTQRRTVLAVISIWMLSVFLAVTGHFWLPLFLLDFFPVVLGFCLICTGLVYCRIYFAVQRHLREIQSLQVRRTEQNIGDMEHTARMRKTAISTFYVYLVFLVCSLPEYCTNMVVSHGELSDSLKTFRLYSWTLVCVNSSLNPVIYCWSMRHIRHTIINILRNTHPCRK